MNYIHELSSKHALQSLSEARNTTSSTTLISCANKLKKLKFKNFLHFQIMLQKQQNFTEEERRREKCIYL